MKKLSIFLVLVIVFMICAGVLFNFNVNSKNKNADYLRIHIRANSNSDIDQEVKYKIKDEYISYLTPKLAFCTSKDEVLNIIASESENLVSLANSILLNEGFMYSAKLFVRSEMFPTRAYEGYTLESGVYDALIVELGNAEGNNWWCVIYPPLCFTNYSSANYVGVVYKSKIWEIIKKFFS